MIKHIALFQLKTEIDAQTKRDVMFKFKKGIEELKAKIGCIKSIEVGLNSNPDEDFDIALVSEFESMADLKTYASHPDHLAVAALLKDYKKSRSCVDYEF